MNPPGTSLWSESANSIRQVQFTQRVFEFPPLVGNRCNFDAHQPFVANLVT